MHSATVREVFAKHRQLVYLIGASIGGLFLGLATNVVLSKLMSPENYGDFYFLLNCYTLFSVVFSFGVFYSGSRLVLKSESEEDVRRSFGDVLVLTLAVYLITTVALYLFGRFADAGFSVEIKWILAVFAPGCLVFLMASYFEALLPAANKISLLANARLVPKVLFLVLLCLIYAISGKKHSGVALIFLSYLIASAVCYLWIFGSLRPIPSVRPALVRMMAESKSFGFNVYLGSLFAVGGTAFAGVAIGVMGVNNKEVGYYSIATSLCAPLLIVPSSIAASSIKRFSQDGRIQNGILIATGALLVLLAVGLSAAADSIVRMLWGEAYIKTTEYVYVLAIVSVLYGIADLVNRFLGANGYGDWLRNSSFLIGVSLLLSTFCFVSVAGGIGAAYSRLFASIIYAASMGYYYRKALQIARGHSSAAKLAQTR